MRGDFAYKKSNSKKYKVACIDQLEEKERALVPFIYIRFIPESWLIYNFRNIGFLLMDMMGYYKK